MKWDYEAAPGAGDTEAAIFRGSRSRVEVRQGKAEGFRPEVFVAPNARESKDAVHAALERRLTALENSWSGLTIENRGDEFRIVIPDRHRIGHEAHFALLVQAFLKYVRDPKSAPHWETANMLAKYYVTTQGVELARNQEKELR
jgi:hypothetical protein